MVTHLAPGSAAAKIGLKPGDHIYQLGGYAIRNRRQAMAVVARAHRGRQKRLKVSLYRPVSGEHLSGTIALKQNQVTR